MRGKLRLPENRQSIDSLVPLLIYVTRNQVTAQVRKTQQITTRYIYLPIYQSIHIRIEGLRKGPCVERNIANEETRRSRGAPVAARPGGVSRVVVSLAASPRAGASASASVPPHRYASLSSLSPKPQLVRAKTLTLEFTLMVNLSRVSHIRNAHYV